MGTSLAPVSGNNLDSATVAASITGSRRHNFAGRCRRRRATGGEGPHEIALGHHGAGAAIIPDQQGSDR